MANLKRVAALEAVKYVQDGMKIGLGSGSTVNEFIQVLGEKVANGLNVQVVPASNATEAHAVELGIELIELSQGEQLDLAFDGADEVDERLDLLKGGGGSLVREKIVAKAAKELIIMVDERKVVDKLGAFTLPVEVVPFGWKSTVDRIKELGALPALRMEGDDPFVSNNGNFIVDCDFGIISKPDELHQALKQLVGVVDTGLFVKMANRVFVAGKNGVRQYMMEELENE